ncbi:MAG: DUF4436 family protein [Acidimicrobiales bacterium]
MPDGPMPDGPMPAGPMPDGPMPEQAEADKARHRHRHWIVIGCTLVVIVGLAVAGSVAALHSYRTTVAATAKLYGGCTPVANPKDFVGVTTTIISVDPGDQEAVARVEFFPTGTFSDEYGQLTRPVTVVLQGLKVTAEDSSTGSSAIGSSSTLPFAAGEWMPATDVTLDLQGDETSYPWDSYTNASTGGYNVAVVDGTGNLNGAKVSTCVGVSSSAGGWTMTSKSYPISGIVGFDITIHRAGPVRFYTWFVILLMWALTLAGVGFAIILITREPSKIDPAGLTYLAALLFAFPLIRQTLPGNPELGTDVDLVAYFWAEVIVAVTLIALLVTWIVSQGARHSRRSDPADRPD